MYSRTVSDHFLNPRNVGALEVPDAVGQVGSPGAGEFVVLHLRLQGDVIAEARFRTIGCGPAIAACSLLTEWVTGKTREQALALTSEQLIGLLEGLPPDKGFCAGLAVEALRNALDGSCAGPRHADEEEVRPRLPRVRRRDASRREGR